MRSLLAQISPLLLIGPLLLMGIQLLGCGAGDSQAEAVSSSVTAAGADAKSVAIAAKEELFARLSGRLTEVMQSAGPVAAIRVCSQEATEIAESVGNEFGVDIGRTSDKLRNPKNAPPEWAESLMAPDSIEPQFVALPDGHTGALLPIKLQAKCVMCHGPEAQIAEPIREQLSDIYPDDQAVGFEEGDLRGWFWVDVPLPLPDPNA